MGKRSCRPITRPLRKCKRKAQRIGGLRAPQASFGSLVDGVLIATSDSHDLDDLHRAVVQYPKHKANARIAPFELLASGKGAVQGRTQLVGSFLELPQTDINEPLRRPIELSVFLACILVDEGQREAAAHAKSSSSETASGSMASNAA